MLPCCPCWSGFCARCWPRGAVEDTCLLSPVPFGLWFSAGTGGILPVMMLSPVVDLGHRFRNSSRLPMSQKQREQRHAVPTDDGRENYPQGVSLSRPLAGNEPSSIQLTLSPVLRGRRTRQGGSRSHASPVSCASG